MREEDKPAASQMESIFAWQVCTCMLTILCLHTCIFVCMNFCVVVPKGETKPSATACKEYFIQANLTAF